jgi:ATP-binding cassette subfamily B protein
MPLDRADRLLVRVAGRPGGWLAVLAAATVATVAASLVLPLVVGETVDAVLAKDSARDDLVLLAGVVLVLVLAESLSELSCGYCTSRSTAWLRRGLVHHLIRLGPRGQDLRSVGDVVSRLTGHASAAGTTAISLAAAGSTVVTFAGAILLLGLMDWKLALCQVITLVLAVLFVHRFVDDTSRDVLGYQETQGEVSARLTDAVAGIRTIRAAGTTGQEIRRVLEPVPGLAVFGMAWWRSLSRMAWRALAVQSLAEVVLLIVAGLGVASGELTVGEFLAATGYVHMVSARFYESAYQLAAIGRARAGARRAEQILAEPVPEPGTADLPPGPGALEFRDVAVRDPRGRARLENVRLAIPAGALVAVVGRSGAGKSTFAAVAAGLVEPSAGSVLLDGNPITGVDPVRLREAVSIVFERPVLLGNSIEETVAYGTDAGSDRVEAAARCAQVHDVVTRLPEGYRTPTTGLPLSGGEIQRLGLARALVRSPRLLILDDATSSVDTATEARIGTAITGALPACTRLVVTHRLSSVAAADLVVWLHEGVLRATGRPAELLADPAFRAVFSATEGDGR